MIHCIFNQALAKNLKLCQKNCPKYIHGDFFSEALWGRLYWFRKNTNNLSFTFSHKWSNNKFYHQTNKPFFNNTIPCVNTHIWAPEPETTLDWTCDFDLSETISGIIFFLATEFYLSLKFIKDLECLQSQVSETETIGPDPWALSTQVTGYPANNFMVGQNWTYNGRILCQ